jgi:hypothetical protein
MRELDAEYVEIARRRCIGDSPMFADVVMQGATSDDAEN